MLAIGTGYLGTDSQRMRKARVTCSSQGAGDAGFRYL